MQNILANVTSIVKDLAKKNNLNLVLDKGAVVYADDGLEIGGINGAIEDWREILLPLLLIEVRGEKLVDKRKRKK